ncbi:hypothetical protein JL720_16040 [Aureococcus anophagefferens]|nr:hypothetical protein JL720_16040 [Aureococcus anophagefferens]
MEQVPPTYEDYTAAPSGSSLLEVEDGLTMNQRRGETRFAASPLRCIAENLTHHMALLYALWFISFVIACYMEYALYGDDVFEFDGHHYQVVGGNWVQETWRGAEQDAWGRCYGGAGYLATIDSAEENDFLLRKMTTHHGYAHGNEAWIGATDMTNEGEFAWLDGYMGSTVFWQYGGPVKGLYSNFKDGEPDENGEEDRVCFDGNGGWNDNSCYKRLQSSSSTGAGGRARRRRPDPPPFHNARPTTSAGPGRVSPAALDAVGAKPNNAAPPGEDAGGDADALATATATIPDADALMPLYATVAVKFGSDFVGSTLSVSVEYKPRKGSSLPSLWTAPETFLVDGMSATYSVDLFRLRAAQDSGAYAAVSGDAPSFEVGAFAVYPSYTAHEQAKQWFQGLVAVDAEGWVVWMYSLCMLEAWDFLPDHTIALIARQLQKILPDGTLVTQFIESCGDGPLNFNKLSHECRRQELKDLQVLTTQYKAMVVPNVSVPLKMGPTQTLVEHVDTFATTEVVAWDHEANASTL